MGIDLLLVRRSGMTWAIERAQVVGIAQRGSGAEVCLCRGALPVQAVVAVHRAVPVFTTGPTLRRFLPPDCLGLAVVAGEPVAVLDADFVPSPGAFPSEGGAHHGG